MNHISRILFIIYTIVFIISCESDITKANTPDNPSLSLNSINVQIGAVNPTPLTATISSPANNDVTIQFSANSLLVGITPSCTIPTGSTTCSINVSVASGVFPTDQLTITAYNGSYQPAVTQLNLSQLPVITVNQGNTINVNAGGFTSDSFLVTVSSPVSNSPLVINFGLNNTITSIANNCTIFVGSSSCQINVTTVFNNTTTGSALLTASASGYISGIGSINVAPVPTITLSTSSSLGSPYWSVSGSIGTFNGNLGQGVKLVATVNNLVETQTSINAGFTLTKNINSSYVSSGIQGDIVSFSNLNATNLTSCSISGTSSSCSVTMYNVNPYIPGVTLAVVGSVALNGGTLNLSILNNITQIIVQNVPLQFSYTNNNNTTPIVYYSITTDNSSIQYPTLDQYLANKSNGIAVVAPQVQSIGFNGITALAFTQPLYIVYNTSSGITSCNSTYTSLVNSSTSIGMNSTPSSLLGIWYIPGGGSFVSPPIPYNLNVLATVTIGNPGVSVSSGVTVNGGSYLNPGYVMSYSTLGTNNGNAIQFILRWGTSTTLCTIPPSHN